MGAHSLGRSREAPGPIRPLHVFHIEDSLDDQLLFQVACQRANVAIKWHVSDTTLGAILYLEALAAKGRMQEVCWPDLVVLDLHMPGESGLEVLKHLRAIPQLRFVPVIILSGDEHPSARKEALKLGANSFYAKPSRFEETVALVRDLFATWGYPPANVEN